MSKVRREIEKEAATLEEAKALIAEEMGLPAEQITFEVLEESGKKVLGLFGSTRVRVKGTAGGSAADMAVAYIRDVLAAMDVTDFTCTMKEEAESCTISLEGENLGAVIGRRGETMDALQYLASLVANRVDNAYYRVTLDIGGYREKREQSLVSLARRLGAQTARNGRRHSLEPMNPYERRIIHTAVQDMEGVTSWSVGSEPNRHVVIGPSDSNIHKDNAEESRGEGRRRSGRGGRGGRGGERSENRRRGESRDRRDTEIVAPERPVRQFISRSNPLPMADGATPPSRTESEKEQSASLYGRIDL